MDIEHIDSLSQQNNDLDVLNTNVYQITNNTFSLQKKFSDCLKDIETVTKYQSGFAKDAYQLKDSINNILMAYNKYAGQVEQVLPNEVIEQIGNLPQQITYVNNLIKYVNSCIEVIRYNNDALYSSQPEIDFPVNPDDPTGPSGSVYVNIINHNDSKLGMWISARKFYDLITDSNKNYAEPENIKWNDWTKPEERLNSESLKSVILEQILKVPEDGLYIFWYGGHGVDSSGKQYLSLPNVKVYDNELWSMFKRCKGRVFAIFNCCHAGTMYRGIQGLADEIDEQMVFNQNIRPFGSNWINQEMAARTIYTDTSPTPSQFTSSDPVYVRLTKDVGDMKILCFSASHENHWEIGSTTNGSYFNSAMCAAWKFFQDNESSTYKNLFDNAYGRHRALIASAQLNAPSGGGVVVGTAMCTYTDNFDPSKYRMFK